MRLQAGDGLVLEVDVDGAVSVGWGPDPDWLGPGVVVGPGIEGRSGAPSPSSDELSLGLAPFKDVFRTDPSVAGETGEPEALLSALSTGPVGLGDRAGRADPLIARRTCRADGVLIKPDVPVAAVDESMLSGPAFRNELLVAECWSDHPAGRWSYVVGLHTNPGEDPVAGEIVLAELGDAAPGGDLVVWDWRERTATRMAPDGRWPVSLAREGWAYLVLAPLLAGGRLAVVGDVAKFASAGDARIEVAEVAGGARVTVKGAGETVELTGWGATAPTATPADAGADPGAGDGTVHAVRYDPGTGVWAAAVEVPSRGWTTVDVHS